MVTLDLHQFMCFTQFAFLEMLSSPNLFQTGIHACPKESDSIQHTGKTKRIDYYHLFHHRLFGDLSIGSCVIRQRLDGYTMALRCPDGAAARIVATVSTLFVSF